MKLLCYYYYKKMCHIFQFCFLPVNFSYCNILILIAKEVFIYLNHSFFACEIILTVHLFTDIVKLWDYQTGTK